ncbi:phage tail protein [Chitiniphilus shinanonensis]|uniref:phage tail protein n=1 Tax=Chitiniphilus shinanonensis TaxID=553088 RepID=UPI00306659B4
METFDTLQRGLGAVARAVEAGQARPARMTTPLTEATTSFRAAADALGRLPFMPGDLTQPVQRVVRALDAGLRSAGRLTNASDVIDEGISAARSAFAQASEAFGVVKQTVTKLTGLGEPVPVPQISAYPAGPIAGGLVDGSAAASSARPHLLVLMPDGGAPFYFNLDTAAYDTLKRSSDYQIASQDRLTRRPALQAVGKGAEHLTLSGVIFTAGKAGAGQLSTLRDIAYRLEPVQLTTGYGEVLGRWYLTKVDEEQGAVLADGVPRKQTFSLEFNRYGDDLQNV